MKKPFVTIHVDGACKGNPGPGGYAAVLSFESRSGDTYKRVVRGGFARTTNNRMELYAVIAGLEALTMPCAVEIVTDSQYVWQGVQGITTARTNLDLWERLFEALKCHELHTINWVRGHSGHEGNERADVNASEAARQPNLPPDTGYKGE